MCCLLTADFRSKQNPVTCKHTVTHTLEADNLISYGGKVSPSPALLPAGLQQCCAAVGLLLHCPSVPGLRPLLALRRKHQPLWLSELRMSLNLQMLWKALNNIYRNLLQLTGKFRVGAWQSSS